MDFSAISANNQFLQTAAMHAHNRNNITDFNWGALEGDDAALMAAAKEFEVYFIQMMFRAMRDTVDDQNSLIPRSQTEEIFRDMVDEQTARAAVEGGQGIGLAQQIFRQMTAGHNPVQAALMPYGAAVSVDEE
ncbi:MAG: rod-binding protein [Clostridiales bacterium]|jgi:flagellar protein FlgJ|nr:rod-binding protein [Clostridiales bacterium]